MNCPHCGKDLICTNCHSLIEHLTPFDKWISDFYKRKGYYVNIQDVDKAIHVIHSGFYITLELKTGRGYRKRSQILFQKFLSNKLKISSTSKNIWPSPHDPEYRGHYVVSVSGSTPENSVITLEGENNIINNAELEDLEHLLLTGRLPEF
jgi:hypothetical protein